MHPAAVQESELLKACETRRQRRSGPGGQHRNKVETAVVIIHTPTGIKAEANERRSQEENRQQAIFRLRINLALAVRQPRALSGYVPSPLWQSRCRAGKIAVNPAHADFPALLAEAMDVVHAADMDVKLAAESLCCSTSQLLKFLQREPEAFAQLNSHRRAAGKPIYH
jgi:hypothetical protein